MKALVMSPYDLNIGPLLVTELNISPYNPLTSSYIEALPSISTIA
jgi:hypothetical protein